jgi:hypothetical protein
MKYSGLKLLLTGALTLDRNCSCTPMMLLLKGMNFLIIAAPIASMYSQELKKD